MFPGWIVFVLFMSHARPVPISMLDIEVVADSSLDHLVRELRVVPDCRHTAFTPELSTAGDAPCPVMSRRFQGNRWLVGGVAPGVYRVAVRISGDQRAETVGLAENETQSVKFDFKRVRLHGRVTRGGNGFAAHIAFGVSDHADAGLASTPAAADSNDHGEYEAALWANTLYVAWIDGKDGNRSGSAFWVVTKTDSDQEKDFVFSSNAVKVIAKDVESGDRIAGARVVYTSAEGVKSQKTNAEGEVRIDSLPAGPFHATAVAEGYVNASLDAEVADSGQVDELTVRLHRKEEGNDFLVQLPDGSPATDAVAYSSPLMESMSAFSSSDNSVATECRFR